MTTRPATKPFRLSVVEQTHTELKQTILTYLKYDKRIAWAEGFNVGAHVLKGKDKNGNDTRRFVRYAFTGCSDILGQLIDGRMLAVEVKVGRDRLSEEQEAFLATVANGNGIAIEARSIGDVIRALDVAYTRPLTQLGRR